jgi:hypothetical protein
MRLTRIVAFMVAAAACRGKDAQTAPVIPPAPPPAAPPHSVYLSVSNLNPERGGTIIVAANVRLDDSFSIASFVGRVGFDPSALQFEGEEPGSDMMHVVNAQAKEVTVAAASARASSNPVLFKLRFHVNDPAGVASLTLDIGELHDGTYHDQMATLRPSSSLVVDRLLAPAVRFRNP